MEPTATANMDSWTIVLLVVACYVSVMALVRLMIRRRNQLFDRFHEEVEAEKERKAQAKKRKEKEEKQALGRRRKTA